MTRTGSFSVELRINVFENGQDGMRQKEMRLRTDTIIYIKKRKKIPS